MYGLHHVQLAMPAGEEDRARAFYADVLGMTELSKPPGLAARGGAWFQAGALELHLGVEADFAPARKAHPGILVDDLGQVQARLDAAGIAVEPDDLLPGFRRFYVADCFGNRLEFLQPAAGDDQSSAAARPDTEPGSVSATPRSHGARPGSSP